MTYLDHDETIIINGTGFIFINPKSEVLLDSSFDDEGKSVNKINIKKNNEKRSEFRFSDVLYEKDDKNHENDIVMKFISIKPNDDKSLIEFIEKYGFFFHTTNSKFAKYSCLQLFNVIKRTDLLVKLMEEINKVDCSYKILANYSIQLFLAYHEEIIDLTSKDGKNCIYETCNYEVRNQFVKDGQFILNNDYDEDFMDSETSKVMSYNEYQSVFVGTDYQTKSNYSHDEGYPYGYKISKSLSIQYDFLQFFLFHTYIKEIDKAEGVIHGDYELIPNGDEEEIIIQMAKFILKSEIEHNIKRILPKFDMETMIGSWDIPDLISTIYFAIFFFNPRIQVVKKCANPRCSNYFTVLNSNKLKIYCRTACCNAVSQQKSRAKKR